MTSACTHCSHCFTQCSNGTPAHSRQPQRVLGCYLIKKIYIVRRPATLKRARTQDAAAWNYSLQSKSKRRAVAQCTMHMGIGPRPSAEYDKGEKCRCCINTMRSGQSMQPYYLHSYASIASLFTGKEMHFASEMHHEHRGAAV